MRPTSSGTPLAFASSILNVIFLATDPETAPFARALLGDVAGVLASVECARCALSLVDAEREIDRLCEIVLDAEERAAGRGGLS